MITVYVRKDLNMRRGKISAQVSHALMALWLDAMRKEEGRMILDGDQLALLKTWDKTIIVMPVIDEDALLFLHEKNKERAVLITDKGRTEFAGRPTHTCVAVIDSSLYKKQSRFVVSEESLPPTKQSIVVNREYKLSKWALAEHVAIGSLRALLGGLPCLDEGVETNVLAQFYPNTCPIKEIVLDLSDEELRSYLTQGFAKIVLKSNMDELGSLEFIEVGFRQENVYVDETLVCCVVGPHFLEKVDSKTSTFKLY
jgi:PTH2 family peptidyl-tRNA hydrolase